MHEVGKPAAWPVAVGGRLAAGAPVLHTATLSVARADGTTVEMFHACRVGSSGEVVARLSSRIGPALAAAAVVRRGIDVSDRVVLALLGGAGAHALRTAGDLAGGALLHGGELNITQYRG
jgi:hypothetical protein